MGYWNWIHDIYNFEDAVFRFFQSSHEAYELREIIIKNLGDSYLWDENGEYKITLKDEYEGFKLKNYDAEKLDAKQTINKLKKELENANKLIEELTHKSADE